MSAARIAGFARRWRLQPRGLRAPYLVRLVQSRAPRSFLPQVAARATGRPLRELQGYFDEVAGPDSAFRQQIEEVIRQEQSRPQPSLVGGRLGGHHGPFLYMIARAARPDRVIETGVANGESSAYILQALAKNGKGHLYSIDLPFHGGAIADGPVAILPGTAIETREWSPIPLEKEPGWLVPAGLRGRWDLMLGDAVELLPRLMEKLGSIDVFLHDSCHTYEHMMFEFEQAYPRLRSGGILLSDDIFLRGHAAFPDFASRVGRPMRVAEGLGVLTKGV